MQDNYRIGVDAGTSALKAALVDGDGNTIRTAEQQVELLRQDSKVEMDAFDYRNALFKLLKDVAGEFAGRISGIAISGAAGSTLMLDDNDTPSEIISWLDTRTVGNAPECLAGLTSDELRRRTGWPCVDSFPLAHIGWWKENRPQQLIDAKWVGICTDYLLYCLCGRHAMDFSTATTMHLVDQKNTAYCQDYIRRLGMRVGQLSRLVAPGTFLGTLTDAAAQATGISKEAGIFSGAFDHPSAARGCHIEKEGEMLLSCGTSWVAFTPVADRDWIIGHRLLCDPFLSHKDGPYGAMFSIQGIGQKVEKLVTEHISSGSDKYRLFNELAEKAGDCDDALDMRSTDVPQLSRERLARAIMNGCAKLFAESLAKLELPTKIERVVLAGGPAKSRIWPGIIEKYTGFSIEVTDSFTGARGAASLIS